MKHILIVETPDTIPDPEFLVEARCAGTFDESEPVEFREVVLPTSEEIIERSTDWKITNDHEIVQMIGMAKWFKSLLK